MHGLKSHGSKLCSLFNIVNNYDTVALTESFFHADSWEVQHSNYLPIFRCDRPGRSGGGVAVLVSNSLVSMRKPELELPNLEMLWVDIVSRTKFELNCWLAFATDHLTRVALSGTIFNTPFDLVRQAGYCDIIITGDMNSDFRDGHNFLNFVNANNMSALINEPTRIAPTSAIVWVPDQFLACDHLSIADISVGASLETSDHCEITRFTIAAVPNYGWKLPYALRFIPNKLIQYIHGTIHGTIMSSVQKT